MIREPSLKNLDERKVALLSTSRLVIHGTLMVEDLHELRATINKRGRLTNVPRSRW
jgi:hypothetical protein